ncbi:hypothetical protein V2J09_018277 [Rumex salicifolius]
MCASSGVSDAVFFCHQQQEKKCSSLVNSLRSNLAETQQQLVIFDKRVRQLETQVLEEQQVSANRKRRAEELEDVIQRLTKELQSEKVVITGTSRDLDFERQRLKAAEDRIKRLSANNAKREREQQEVIKNLQQQEKKCSSLVESLRSNLAETQQQLVIFDKSVRQLETQVLEEQQVSANRKRRAEELEDVIQRLTKAAREEALGKISTLEVVISGTSRDLDFERQRLKGAKDRIMLLETQLRAICATTEEMRELFAKQDEKVEAMHKALVEKQNDQSASIQAGPNQIAGHINEGIAEVKEAQTTGPTSHDVVEPISVEREAD